MTTIAVGSDERTHLTDKVIAYLNERGFTVQLYGSLMAEGVPWPLVGQSVAEEVATGRADEGILFCWTGTGVSIAANKVPGIRAALCDDPETAKGARLWNRANVICLSLRRVSEARAIEILDTWFATVYEPNTTDDMCLAQISAIEARYMPPAQSQSH